MPSSYPDLEKIIKETKDISPAPQILPKLRRLLDDPNSDLDEAIQLIKMDMALTGQILKYANSPVFGAGMVVETLDNAIQRFGFRQVQKLVVVASAKSALSRELTHFETSGHSLFEISLSCAEIMVGLASSERFFDEDVAYTIGLFHGVGKIVVDGYFSKSGILFYENGNDFVTLDKERKILGFDHAEAGAALLKSWRFSDSIVKPIRDQFAPPEKLMDHKGSALCLSFATFASMELLEPGFDPESTIQSFNEGYPEIWENSGLSEERTVQTLVRARDAYQQSVQMTRGV